MCAEVGKDGKGLTSQECKVSSAMQLFKMERIPDSGNTAFQGKKNVENEAGVVRLHSRKDDKLCLTVRPYPSCSIFVEDVFE